MSLQYQKGKPVLLADVGLDERWLQERIDEDPSILGLGDVSVVQREKKQSSGGRIDFLLSDPDNSIMYEVEVMLGQLDESHIIRTIEYWDNERRRWPTREHRAVVIAEEITNRFFNVIALFNRAIPVIAIQLNALQIDDKVLLNFTKVLDIYEEPEEEGSDAPPADRPYWDKRCNKDSLSIVDRCIGVLATAGKGPRITYNRHHIAMGGARQNFAWFHPRKAQSHCHVHVKTGEQGLQSAIAKLEEVGISTGSLRKDLIKIIITPPEMKQHESVIGEILGRAAKDVGGDFV